MTYESSEWRSAVDGLTEMGRATTAIAVRLSAGLCGELDDVRYGGGDYR